MQKQLKRAFARLNSLYELVSEKDGSHGFVRFHRIALPYLTEYREILAELNGVGFEVSGFDIQPSALFEDPDGNEYADGDFFRMKLKALLTYFTIEGPQGELSEEQVTERLRIGFHPAKP